MIPKHNSCLYASDYLPYLTQNLIAHPPLVDGLREVWGKKLPESRLYPTPTGRHALWYFLEMIDLQPSDEVLVASYNFYVIVRLLLQMGLKPVFVDIDPDTLCMDAEDLAKKITPNSRLVVVTHMFGNPANLKTIRPICIENNLLLFEDCAHAVGTLCKDKQVGQFGDGALFSFGVQKLVNSFGGGLLLLSNNHDFDFDLPPHSVPRVASFVSTFFRALISFLSHPYLYGPTLHSAQKAFTHWEKKLPGLNAIIDPGKDNPNYRFRSSERSPYKSFMSTMHRSQLERLDENIARRRQIVSKIKTELSGINEINLLNEDKYGRSNNLYFGIYVSDPYSLAEYLEKHGIESSPQEYYDCASLQQFTEFAAPSENSLYASRHLLRLPSYPWLRDEDVDHISSSINSWFAENN